VRAIIGICTMVISLGLAGLAVGTHNAPNAPERGMQAAAEDGGRACLIDYDTPCSILR
jgi:hypothetical protein